MPIDYKDYPDDWQEIRARILKRAGNHCEECYLGNGVEGYRDVRGEFHLLEGPALEVARADPDFRVFKIVLTIAHLNHEKMDSRPENLRALCQQCHLQYDAKIHARNRKYGRKAFGDQQGKLDL